MQTLLCTIGFAGKTAEEFFALLGEAGVQQVIDIRQHREGQLSGFAKHPDLAFLLDRVAHIGYAHEPQLAPTPELLKAYREDKNWAAYEAAFLNLMSERGIPQTLDTNTWPVKIALLCSEPGPEKCHRRLVGDLLAAHWKREGRSVEVRHLVAARKKKTPNPSGRKRSAQP
jgi:uncharacterized protein (DUF488 family)